MQIAVKIYKKDLHITPSQYWTYLYFMKNNNKSVSLFHIRIKLNKSVHISCLGANEEHARMNLIIICQLKHSEIKFNK